MAQLIRDYKLEDATALVEGLPNNEENDLIRYLIYCKNNEIEEQRKRIREYADWFEKLESFLPNRNPIFR